jgi:DNA-directed RNA polymerase specialized sigma24 family protein
MGTAVAINREWPLTKSAVTGVREAALPKSGHETFQALVMQALQLRRIYREVFILRDIRGYSTQETAEILGISEGSVVRRLARARVQMDLDEQAVSNV